MDIQPTPAWIESQRNASLRWPIVLGELIDNSFDAGATRIVITFGNSSFEIADDGKGCDQIGAMLTIGKHFKTPTTKLGRYGIGLKEAAIWMWGRLRIVTTHEGTRRAIEVDWSRLSKQDRWEIADPAETKCTANTGTVICCDHIEKPIPKDFNTLASRIGYLYFPAIRAGKQIIIKTTKTSKLCAPFELPTMTDVMDTVVSVGSKSARVRCGILKDGVVNPSPGFTYTYGHRVIKEACSLGAGEYSTASICGLVELSDNWRLSKNKDDISDHQVELGDAVLKAVEPLLQKAHHQAMSIASSRLCNEVSDIITNALCDASDKDSKAKRCTSGGSTGTVKPTQAGSPHKNAARKQLGNRMAGGGRIVIDFVRMDGTSIGTVDSDTWRVSLNLSHFAVDQARKNNDTMAVCTMVAGLWVNAVLANPVQQKLPGFVDVERKYETLVGELLNSMKSVMDKKSPPPGHGQ